MGAGTARQQFRKKNIQKWGNGTVCATTFDHNWKSMESCISDEIFIAL